MIVLDSSHMPWKDAFKSLTIDFEGSGADFEIRQHGQLRKRQDSTATAAPSSADTAASTTISFPIPPSSSPTPKGHDAHGEVGFHYLNTSIIPPDFPNVDNVALHGPLL